MRRLSRGNRMSLKTRKISSESLTISISWLIALSYLLKIWSDHMPARDWDAASAHSYVGQALFKGWYQDDWLGAANGAYLWPTTDVLMFIPRFLGFPKIGNLILCMIIVYVTIRILWSISKLVLKTETSKFQMHAAVILSMLSPYWLSEIGTTLSSWISAPIVLGGLFYLLRYQTGQGGKFDLFTGGLLLGISFALRLTNVIYVISSLIVLGIFLVWSSLQSQQKIKSFLFFNFGLLVGILPIIPWWIFTFVSTGNPVFPYYNKFFKSPYYSVENFKDERWLWNIPNSILNIPTGWSMGTPVAELKSVDIRISITLLLYVGLLLVYIFRRTLESILQNFVDRQYLKQKVQHHEFYKFQIFFHLWVVTSTILWIYLFGYVRYWIAIEILLGLAIVHLILILLEKYKWRNLTIGVVLVLAAASISPPNWTMASSVAGIGTFEEPWDSDLTREVSKVTGVLLVEGSPVAFLRETSPKVTNMINIDFPNTPDKFKTMARDQLKVRNLSLVTTKGNDQIMTLSDQISNWLDVEVKVNCRDLIGPITVQYNFCLINLAAAKNG